jgi:hypothetical protein
MIKCSSLFLFVLLTLWSSAQYKGPVKVCFDVYHHKVLSNDYTVTVLNEKDTVAVHRFIDSAGGDCILIQSGEVYRLEVRTTPCGITHVEMLKTDSLKVQKNFMFEIWDEALCLRESAPSEIYFEESNSCRLTRADRIVLDVYAQALKDNTKFKIQILGHRDYFERSRLSMRRALAIKRYFLSQNVPDGSMELLDAQTLLKSGEMLKLTKDELDALLKRNRKVTLRLNYK